MTLQELAKQILNVNWVAVECDDMHANHEVYVLIKELEQLSPNVAIRLLMKCVQVNTLTVVNTTELSSMFNSMRNMEFIDYQVTCYQQDPY